MRSLLLIVIIAAATSLYAQVECKGPSKQKYMITATGVQPVVDIQTFSESCPGESNGSVYARAVNKNWKLRIYRNDALVNNLAIAGKDTFLHSMAVGCYTFIYTGSDGFSDTISRLINGPPQVVSTCRFRQLNRPDELAVLFTNTSTGAATFDWDFGDGAEHSAEISPVHTYAFPGTYTVTLTAYNRAACTAVSTYTINVQPAERTESSADPAPTSTGLFIESSNGSARIAGTSTNTITELNVYSVTGQLIYSGAGNDNQFPYAAPGIYTARIVYANGEQESKNVPLN